MNKTFTENFQMLHPLFMATRFDARRRARSMDAVLTKVFVGITRQAWMRSMDAIRTKVFVGSTRQRHGCISRVHLTRLVPSFHLGALSPAIFFSLEHA